MKKISNARLADKVAVLIQKLVRLKAADENGYCQCVTCMKIQHWTELQGGHFISRSRTSTKLIEENINPQCRRCNGPLRGNTIPYTTWMIDKHGRDFVDKLWEKSREPKKWNRIELEQLIEHYKQQIKEYEKKLC